MTTRSRGAAAGFDWLTRGLHVAWRHPKPLLAGAALLLVACLLPSLLVLPLQWQAARPGAQPGVVMFAATMLLPMLLGLLIVPLYAGYLQLIDAAERGRPARVRDIFKPYAQGQVLRLIGYALLLMLIYLVTIAVVLLVTGSGIGAWYMQVMAAQINHVAPPGPPAGFMTAVALTSVLWLYMMGCYSISLGQVSLGNRGVLGALGDGLAGALKNVLPLLVFAVSLTVMWIVAVLAILLVALVLALIAKLVGAWLVFVVVVPLYIAMVLLVVAAMFGVMYHLWRDVCDGNGVSEPAPAAA